MSVQSWGRFPAAKHDCQALFWRHQEPPYPADTSSVLPFGMGRSYGDVCLNNNATLLLTRQLNRLISFDPQSGLLCAEAGISLAEILAFCVPRGWFPPVTPGTKYVTLGGMVANDIHGKNHHHDGSFGHHVSHLKLWRSDMGAVRCSPKQHAELFYATLGGLGITGLITEVAFQLTPIEGPAMRVESHRFDSLEAFLKLSEASDRTFRYTVSWLDTSQLGKGICRGIFYRGNHCSAEMKPSGSRLWRLPFQAPGFLLNSLTLRTFNKLYYRLHYRRKKHQIQHYNPFFYPLDRLLDWNRLYGQRGPLQYQCVVPHRQALERVFARVADSRQVSFLTVLKQFGSRPSLGPLSFPREGFTLAMDFQVNQAVLELCKALDQIVLESEGAVYPAKDARMAPEHFQAFFPRWPEWLAQRDPKYSSSFLRRVLPHVAVPQETC